MFSENVIKKIIKGVFQVSEQYNSKAVKMVSARRTITMMRLGRCVAFLAAAAFLLPFTILLMVADQQYNLTYSSKRVFYQEVRQEQHEC